MTIALQRPLGFELSVGFAGQRSARARGVRVEESQDVAACLRGTLGGRRARSTSTSLNVMVPHIGIVARC